MRSCKSPISEASVGLITEQRWACGPTARKLREAGLGETGKRYLPNKSTSWFFSSRKYYSVTASADSATRTQKRAPGDSFITAVNQARIFGTGLDDGEAVSRRFFRRQTFFVYFSHLDERRPRSFSFHKRSLPSRRAFADPGEHGDTAVQFRDVIDQLHDDGGLADNVRFRQTRRAPHRPSKPDQIRSITLMPGGQNLRAGGFSPRAAARRDGSADHLSAFPGPCSAASTGSPVTLNTADHFRRPRA